MITRSSYKKIFLETCGYPLVAVLHDISEIFHENLRLDGQLVSFTVYLKCAFYRKERSNDDC